MSTTYTGEPGNDYAGVNLGPLNVSNATNATPIVITTAAAHNLKEGERVYINAVQGNSAANGAWYVHVTGANTFSLYSQWTGGAVATPSVGSGAYTAGGKMYYLCFYTSTTLPSDGDAVNASAINTSAEATLDRTNFLGERIGGYRIHAMQTGKDGTAGTNWSNNYAVAHNVTAYDTNFNTAFYVTAALDNLDILPNDIVELELITAVDTGGPGFVGLRLGIEVADYGVAFTNVSTNAGAFMVMSNGNPYVPITLRARIKLSSLTHGKNAKVLLEGRGISGASTYSLIGEWQINTTIYRLQTV